MSSTNPDELFDLGVQQYDNKNYSAAIASFETALQGYRGQPNQLGIGRSLNAIGLVNYQMGNDDLAYNAFQQAVQIFEGLQDLIRVAMTHNNLGLVHDYRKQHVRAVEVYDLAQQKITTPDSEILDKETQAKVLNNKGLSYYHLGQEQQTAEPKESDKSFQQAALSYKRALLIFREIKDLVGERLVTNNIINLLLYRLGGFEGDGLGGGSSGSGPG